MVKAELDRNLMDLNDDYRTERSAALRDVIVKLIPAEVFYDFMKLKGKEGGQNKFPRVLNGLVDEWEKFLTDKGYKI